MSKYLLSLMYLVLAVLAGCATNSVPIVDAGTPAAMAAAAASNGVSTAQRYDGAYSCKVVADRCSVTFADASNVGAVVVWGLDTNGLMAERNGNTFSFANADRRWMNFTHHGSHWEMVANGRWGQQPGHPGCFRVPSMEFEGGLTTDGAAISCTDFHPGAKTAVTPAAVATAPVAVVAATGCKKSKTKAKAKKCLSL